MSTSPASSGLRFDKLRVRATIVLTGGVCYDGCFFVAGAAAHHDGPERVSDLLASASGLLPFEASQGSHAVTRLVNPRHIVFVTLDNDEATRDPAHAVGRPQAVALRLSTGEVVVGTVRVSGPSGHDRLSDWTRQPDRFRYVETADGLRVVNAGHVVEVSEVPEP